MTLRLTTSKAFDNLNRLSWVSNATFFPVSAHAYHYNAANQRDTVTLLDGSYWTYGYDSLGQVTSAKKRWSDGTWVAGQQFEYGYDDIGNRVTTKAGGDANGANLRTASYAPNSLNQYASRTVPGAVDLLGWANRTATVTVNSQGTYRKNEYYQIALPLNNSGGPVWAGVTVSASLSGNTVNRTGNLFLPPATESFMHDADGNLTQDGRWVYTWDGENRLKQLESLASAPQASKRRVVWEYDWRGRRIRQTVYDGSGGSYVMTSDVKFLYDGWRCVAEFNAGNNALLRSGVWGLDLSGSLDGAGGVGGLLMLNSVANGVHFYAYDGNGNVAALVKATDGTVTANYEYDAFGQTLRATGPMAVENPYRFSTKRTDSTTDLILYEHRLYNPSTGRWPSRDPIEEKGGPNLYGFVRNNPINSFDPFGMESFQFVVTTIIRPPDAEQGVKTKHVVVIDEYGKTTRVNRFIGYTDLIIEAPTGGGTLGESVTGSHPKFKVRMWGVAWSAALGPLFNIDYDVTFDLDLCQRKGELIGEHDTYPSYNVQGIGQQLRTPVGTSRSLADSKSE